jgi:hypothetical protein
LSSLPPQRRGGPQAPGQGPARGAPKLSPKEGVQQAEARLGLPCFHAGQRVQGIFSCVADQFQINNRGVLPSCPQCGEIIWAYTGSGPRPVPEGEEAQPQQEPAAQGPAKVEEGVKLDTGAPAKVEEGVKLEP